MKTRISLLLIIVGLLSVSCKDFLDVNTDPNNPTEVTPDLVLPTGLNYTATYVQENRGLNHLGNMMMFNYGEAYGYSWYDQEFRYNVTATFYDNLFDDAYSSALKQYEVLANLPEEYGYYKAIGNIMQAYHYQILVDLYGDVPYSEALNRAEVPTPKYDDAAVIYDSLLVQLSDAISTIETTDGLGSAVGVGTDDTMFGGDMVQWEQFANTVKIRILTRLSDVKDAEFINAELDKIPAGAFITSDVVIDPGYLNEEDKQNPYWADFGWTVSGTPTSTNQATSATQFVIDHLTGTGDDRIDYIFEEPDTGHKGVDQGAYNDSQDQHPDNVSNLGPGILKSATMGSVIFTLAEHNLNMAELAEEGFNVTGTARDYYEAGIEASFAYLGVDVNEDDNTDDDAEAYYTNGAVNVDWDNSPDKLDAIMTQKWIATMGITAEQAWFDYNRTGYPSGQPTVTSGFPVSELAGSNNDRPVRLYYPSSEATTNSENLPDQPNVFNDKIFWAQ